MTGSGSIEPGMIAVGLPWLIVSRGEQTIYRSQLISRPPVASGVGSFPLRMSHRGHNGIVTTRVHEELNETYPAVAASIKHARRSVAQFAARSGIGDAALDAIRLAVSEAVTNVVLHAYRDRTGTFHLTAAVAGEELWVLVADDGCGYKTPPQQPGLGWGLTIIAQHSKHYIITERATGGTEVRMRFPIPPTGEPAIP
jgi:serine/threonine-protein kinase RsbW